MRTSTATSAARATEAERRYRDLARDPRYGHYARIPERVCRCLDYFGFVFDRASVAERLRAYYLFVGVADDAIDAGSVRAGAEILRRLTAPDTHARSMSFDDGARLSAIALATEALRRHFGGEPHASLRESLEGLYCAVVREREAETMSAYVAARVEVGHLTAEVSYQLVGPLLSNGRHEDLRRFLIKVGAVGCLLDSVIDLKSDEQLGLLNFVPTHRDRLRLAARTLREGCTVLLRHPRLLFLFLEAAADILRDRLAARAAPPAHNSSEEITSALACERTA